MKRLLILRHAKSSWNKPGLSDHDRPLNQRGQRDAPNVGALLLRSSLLPDLILSSSALRARSTVELLAEQSGFQDEIHFSSDFYLAEPSAWVAAIRQIDDSHTRLLIVGHNPGLESLVQNLTGHDEHFPTAALAHIELPLESWQELSQSTHGQLVDLWRPKEL